MMACSLLELQILFRIKITYAYICKHLKSKNHLSLEWDKYLHAIGINIIDTFSLTVENLMHIHVHTYVYIFYGQNTFKLLSVNFGFITIS